MPPGAPGCWTCRVRHRKCDLKTPCCKECTDRHIQCHGYGTKPVWMDGGSEEQKERLRIKAAVNDNFRHVKKMQSRNCRSRSARASSRPSTETPGEGRGQQAGETRNSVITPPHHSRSPSPLERRASAPLLRDSPNRLLDVNDQGRGHAHGAVDASPQPLDSNDIDHQEACLLMHYLDQVFQWQFPYHDSRSRLGNRGWLFLLLIKRGPLHHAALSLSSLHQSALLGTEEDFQRKHKALDHHSRALCELCGLMKEKGDKLREDHAQLEEFLACTFMLISFQVFSGAEHDWLLHLDAVAAVVNLLSPEAIFNPPSYPRDFGIGNFGSAHYTMGGVHQGLEFLVVTVIWFDLFACLSTGRVPSLPYHRWLQIPGLNMADLMGCQNWVMLVIGDLAHFGIWKEQQEKDGLLSVRELAGRGQEIEKRIENGLQSLDLARGYDDSESMSNWVTRLFALACLVLLHTIVSGPLPAIPEIQSAVARSIIALQNRPRKYSLTGSVWALCVIGCMAQPQTRPFFESLMTDLVHSAGRCGNTATVFKIMRKCWEMQETTRADCRITMHELGMHAILI